MKKIYAIRQIVVAFTALIFLSWAFFQNGLWARIIIAPCGSGKKYKNCCGK